jgi:CubicO group peptidase (beta-lactamase class C family)
MGRRSLLGLLGATPVAIGGAWTLSGSAEAIGADNATRSPADTALASVPVDLRPGGAFDRFLARLAAQDRFSGTMLVAHGGRTVLARNFGMADKAKSVPNTIDTVYCLASVTKLFTAVAIAQLVQQGKLKYEGTLGSYVDGFPTAAADTITVHQLLTHTSGMGDYHVIDGWASAAAGWSSAEQVLSQTMDFIRKAPLGFTPGTGHAYSNSAYTVLGAIVQQVTGQSYYEYMRQHVFVPAGMAASGFFMKPQWQSDRRIAHPYATQSSGQRTDVVDQELFIGLPDGNAFATAPDMVRFTRALLDGTLLEPAYVDLVVGAKFPAATLPAKPGLPAKAVYEAYGPAATLRNGTWAVGHNGGSAGISTLVEWYPSDWIAVKLTNYDPQDTMVVDDEIQGILTQPVR